MIDETPPAAKKEMCICPRRLGASQRRPAIVLPPRPSCSQGSAAFVETRRRGRRRGECAQTSFKTQVLVVFAESVCANRKRQSQNLYSSHMWGGKALACCNCHPSCLPQYLREIFAALPALAAALAGSLPPRSSHSMRVAYSIPLECACGGLAFALTPASPLVFAAVIAGEWQCPDVRLRRRVAWLSAAQCSACICWFAYAKKSPERRFFRGFLSGGISAPPRGCRAAPIGALRRNPR